MAVHPYECAMEPKPRSLLYARCCYIQYSLWLNRQHLCDYLRSGGVLHKMGTVAEHDGLP